MRGQSGTSSLRAILYMDEVFGYFPPTANPPSKTPMLTLLKQARAFGLGVRAGDAEPGRSRLQGAGQLPAPGSSAGCRPSATSCACSTAWKALAAAGAFDRAEMERMLSGLGNRVFLMNNVHDDQPVVFQTRWALSYLRGPLTGEQIPTLMAPRSERDAASAPPRLRRRLAGEAASRPSVPADVPEYFLAATAAGDALLYKPMVMGSVKLHFVDAKLALDQWQTTAYLAPLSDSGSRSAVG